MGDINVSVISNGYRAEGLQDMIAVFNRAAGKLFPGCEVEHFYYGDTLDMIGVRLPSGNYAHFNLTAKRLSFNGHTCTNEEYEKFSSMTFNDDLFRGELFDIAG